MIFIPVKDLGSCAPLISRVEEVLRFLSGPGRGQLTPGQPAAVAPGISAVLLRYETAAPEGKAFELHRRCIDLQLLLQGEEQIHYSREPGRMVRPYDEAKDNLLCEAQADAILRARPGMAAVFFPEELHRPGCTPQGAAPAACEKLVVKISV